MHTLRITKRILDKVLGTNKSDELSWKFRHFFDKNWAKSYISEAAINHPHRKLLVDEISKLYPFKNVLEIGSASGANLYLLAEKFSEAKFYGIDVSLPAVKEGQKFFKKNGIKNVWLNRGDSFQLKKYTDKSIDIILTDATFLYIAPDKIRLLIKEMKRVAKKAIILCEQHTEGESFYNDKWVHNYRELFKKIIPEAKTDFIKISENVWAGDWGKYGYIIEVFL